jgi:Skp family chaperone for outer membrane proteins
MKKKTLALSVCVFAALCAPIFAAPPAPPPALPAPKILVFDQSAVMTASKVGQDISRQAKTYSDQAKADLEAQAKALQAQGQALQQQVAILSADVKEKKMKDFQAKEAALQQLADRKQAQIQYSFALAQQQMGNKLGPILKQIMTQRGANMLIDKRAVLMATVGGVDITPDVINMLNQQISSLKVNLVSPPAAPAH